MTPERAVGVLGAALRAVAPDVDARRTDIDGLLQEEFDLDSMDFVELLNEIRVRTGIDIPERDYPALVTFRSFLGYLAGRPAISGEPR